MSAVPRLRVDMHAHTRLSHDSLNDPERLVRAALARGIDRLAVTDHNQVEAALRLRDRFPDHVLVGEEVKTREGFDVIGLLLSEPIPRGTPAAEACQRIRAQGGVVYLPHPFDTLRSGAGLRHLAALEPWIDVVEVHNARCFRRATNRRAAVWAAEHGKRFGAGSDAHTLAEVGNASVSVPPFEPERDSFLAALDDARPEGCVRSSPGYRLASTYAKLHKRFIGPPRR